jgi:hypothetical protein
MKPVCPGWAYLKREMSQILKVLWIVFLIIIVILSGFVLVISTRQYLEEIFKKELHQKIN